MGRGKAQSPTCLERPSLAEQEGVARLRSCGVTGDDSSLVALLEAVDFDVNRAADIFLDRLNGEPSTASTAENSAAGIDIGFGLSALSSKASARRPKYERKRKGSGGDTLAELGEALPRASYAQLSQKVGHRLSARVSLITPEGQQHPTGLHYEVGPSESYNVDIVRMHQTHAESGSMRKIRREKKGVWRFCKKGSTWGVYPGEVSVELERIYLTLGRQKATETLELDDDLAAEEILGDPQFMTTNRVDVKRGVHKNEIRGDPQFLTDPVGFAQASLDDLERSLSAANAGPSLQSVETACELLFSAAEAGGLDEVVRAGDLLEVLVAQHGLTCSISHARRAGLVVGSMRLLQAVLSSAPGLRLVGLDIFDKKYPKLSMQDTSRKNCVRCLLARGMQLGSSNCVPQGKLLRKVEADAVPAWTLRYLDSMMLTYPQLPETVRDRVSAWVGVKA